MHTASRVADENRLLTRPEPWIGRGRQPIMTSTPRSGIRALLVALLVLSAVGCQGLPGLPAPAIDGTGWRATEVAGLPPVPGSEPTVFFDGGRIGGSTGCNSFGGEITVEGTSVKVGEIATTLIGCEAAIGDVERRFSEALAASQRLTIRADGTLVLAGPAGDLVFRPDPTVRP